MQLQALSDYSCEDSDITFRLYNLFQNKLTELGMDKLCEEIEYPLVGVLARMERRGVTIDVDFLNKMSLKLEQQLNSLTK